MATHDYVIANGTGSAVRSDINNVLAAIVSTNSASSEPSTKYAYQFWADTNSGYLKIRNAANNAWIQLFKLDGTLSDIPVEGTVIKSTGESGGTKFLREDGDGTCSWQTPASGGAALTGSTNNTIVTVTGANAIAGEANLTFDGSGDLTVKGNESTSANLYLIADEGDDNGDGWRIGSNQDDNDLTIANNTSGSYVDKLTLFNNGNVKINDGDLVIGTSGHGIDFSATTDGSGTDTSELLDDYEEGEWTPILNTGDFGVTSYATRYARYTKIGRAVHIVMYIMLSNKGSNSGYLKLWGLPYTNAASPAYTALACWCTSMEIGGARSMIAYVNPGSQWCAIQKYNESSGDANWCTEADLNNNSEIRLAGTYFV